MNAMTSDTTTATATTTLDAPVTLSEEVSLYQRRAFCPFSVSAAVKKNALPSFLFQVHGMSFLGI